MGREIRKVPPNWEHPRYTEDNAEYSNRIGTYMPMHDDHFDGKFSEWLANFDRIRMGDMDDFERKFYPLGLREWLQGDGRPQDPTYYRPYTDDEATWFQVYETVSEGTPVTPPFATKAELVDYLATKGDFWDQKRGEGAWHREAAARFVGSEYAPSFIVQSTPAGNKVFAPRDGLPS